MQPRQAGQMHAADPLDRSLQALPLRIRDDVMAAVWRVTDDEVGLLFFRRRRRSEGEVLEAEIELRVGPEVPRGRSVPWVDLVARGRFDAPIRERPQERREERSSTEGRVQEAHRHVRR